MSLGQKITVWKLGVGESGWGDWIYALLFAALLNLTMFGLMPGLVQQVPTMGELPDTIGDIVQVIRVKQPEIQPEKKELKEAEPEPAKPRAVPAHKEITPQHSQPLRLKPRLPFELNPALPEISTSLVMPPLEHFSMNIDAPDMESTPDDSTLSDASATTVDVAPVKDVYGTGELDSPITAVVKASPLYPIRAKRRGIEGWVKVKFQVDRSGFVNAVEVVESSPQGMFEDNVVKCVRQWKFKPGTVRGKKVNTLVETTVRFELE